MLYYNIKLNKNRPKGLFFNKNMANKLINYIKASVEEMKKVTWPTKKETYNYTLLVIGISLAVAAFLGALDYIFNWGLELIIK
jgi:preprotein translocase subunit SecE